MEAISLLIVVAILVAYAVFVAVQLSTALRDAVRSVALYAELVDKVHQRDQKQLSQALDRLMARDFESFKVYNVLEEDETETTEGLTPLERRQHRPWLQPVEDESAFRADHERRYGGEDSDTLRDLEEEGLPK